MPRYSTALKTFTTGLFSTAEDAKKAFDAFRSKYPSVFSNNPAVDLSRVEGNKVMIQDNSYRNISRSGVKQFLLECTGAIPG